MEQTLFTTIKIDDLVGIIKQSVSDALFQKKDENCMKEPTDDLLSIEDIQILFNVSKVTVHKWKKKGLLPYYKMNRKVYFKKSEVIASMSHKKRKMEV